MVIRNLHCWTLRLLASVLLSIALYGCASTPGREQPLGYVVSTAFSPDGTLVAASTSEGEVALFDANPLWFRRLLTRESDKTPLSRSYRELIAAIYRPLPLAFSPDGAHLAASDAAGNMVVWQVQSASEKFRLSVGGAIADLAFVPNGQMIVTAGLGVVMWSIQDGARIGEFTLPSGARGTAVGVTPDGTVLAVGLSNGEIAMFDTTSRALLRVLNAHRAVVTGLAFQSDGTAFASNAGGYDLRLWRRDAEGGYANSATPAGAASAAETFERAQGAGTLLWLLGTLRGFQIVGAPTMGAPPTVAGAESQFEKAARATPHHCGPRVAFSANGRYLASTANLMICAECIGTLSPSFLLFLTDLETGKTTTVRDLGCEVAISPDGRVVAVAGPGAPQIRDFNSGQRLPVP